MTAEASALALSTEEQIPRDRWSRPLITPPEGGKPVAYTRCTTFVKALGGDSNGLILWAQRLTALGLARRQDLRMAVATAGDGTTKESKDALNKLVEQAKEAGGGSSAATTGTALHKATEMVDRGEDISHLPAEFQADLKAYRDATNGIRTVQIETFGVQDELKIGGTWDRISHYQGRNYIADVKTGRVDDFTASSIAMQLAVYSRCKRYDPATGTRHDLPDVDQDKAIVINLPAGTGTAQLFWIDINAGWEAVQVAARARAWQTYGKAKNLLEGFVPEATQPLIPVPGADAFQVPAAHALMNAIREAPTMDALLALWGQYQGVWTAEHSAAATVRQQQLQGVSA